MFDRFVFAHTPPPTVATAIPTPASTSASSSATTATAVNSSTAVSLSNQLGDLAGTVSYLQSVILALTKGLGVTINPASDPEAARALTAIYGTLPPAVSVQMYSNQVAAEIGAAQVNMVAGNDSTVQANPYQQQSLIAANKAVEEALANEGSFLALSALTLRTLQTQQAIYTNMQSSLAQYPAAAGLVGNNLPDVIQASTIDVGTEVGAAVQNWVDDMTKTYGSLFNALVSVSSVSQDIVCMVNSLSALTKTSLAQVKSLFDMTSSMSVKESFVDITNGLTSFVFMQMQSEAAAMTMQLDRIAQMALTPLKTLGGQLGAAVNSANGSMAPQLSGVLRTISGTAILANGPLAGLSASNTAASACGSDTVPLPKATTAPACMMTGGIGATISNGANDLSTLISYGLSKANQKFDIQLNALKKMMTRSQKDTCNQVKLLAVVNNLTTLSSLSNSILSQQQKGSSVANTTTNTLATVGAILANTTAGNKVTYTVQNGTVTVTPPVVPAPTAAATTVFANAGIQTSLAGITQSV